MKQPEILQKKITGELPVLYNLLKEMKSDPSLVRFVSSTRHQTRLYGTGFFYKPLSRFVSQHGTTCNDPDGQ
ncbi:MAG: hypothetical protein SF052_15025 [Bacteroidia bacterium]|nr:hypothetical protein [Bacteroidia bacterium]